MRLLSSIHRCVTMMSNLTLSLAQLDGSILCEVYLFISRYKMICIKGYVNVKMCTLPFPGTRLHFSGSKRLLMNAFYGRVV